MAKKRKKGRRLGSVIRVRKMQGLGQLDRPSSWMGSAGPAAIGGLTAAGTAIGLRYFMKPTSDAQMTLLQNAPYVGLGTGLLASLLVSMTSGKPAGVGVAAGATVVTAVMAASEMMAKQRLAEVAAGGTLDAMKPYGLGRGTGAIVMEPHASRGYGAGPLGSGVGAIVATYSSAPRRGVGAYGDVVNLNGINPSAFGTQGFNVQGAY